jgi:hypothetical protein
MSDPVCGPRTCDIVGNHIFRIARVLAKVKLSKEINLALLFDVQGPSERMRNCTC